MWEDSLYIDSSLPFGLRSSPKIFNAIADAVEWIPKEAGDDTDLHYLDDYLLIGAPASAECNQALEPLLQVFDELGLPITVEGPVTQLTFLGFELDSTAMEVRLPAVKLYTLQVLLSSWLERRRCTKRELESLVGFLRHASRVVLPGKTFLRHMFELLALPKRPHHRVQLNKPFRSDLYWWQAFLAPFNGVSLSRKFNPPTFEIQFASDASGNVGCGAICPPPLWLQVKWGELPALSALLQDGQASITLKEVLPIVLACAVWGQQWQNISVLVHCDNQGAVAVVNTGYSKIPAIMHLLRCLFFIWVR